MKVSPSTLAPPVTCKAPLPIPVEFVLFKMVVIPSNIVSSFALKLPIVTLSALRRNDVVKSFTIRLDTSKRFILASIRLLDPSTDKLFIIFAPPLIKTALSESLQSKYTHPLTPRPVLIYCTFSYVGTLESFKRIFSTSKSATET